jgi:hypothetical protein
MARKALLYSTVLALIAGSVVGTGWAGSASAAASTQLVSGNVVAPAGSAPATASVSLVAWPSDDYLAAQTIGQTVPTEVLATATPSAAGSYTLSPNLAGVGANYVDPDGLVNLELDTTLGSQSQEWSLSAAVPGSVAATQDPQLAVAGSTPDTVNFNMSQATVTQTDSTGVSETDPVQLTSADTLSQATHGVGPGAAPATGNSPDDHPDPAGCSGWTYYSYYGNRNETFLNLYTYSGDTTVTESAGSTHTLGVGADENNNGWGLDGEHSITKEASASASNSWTSNEQLKNTVNEHEYQRYCWLQDDINYHAEYKIEAVSFNAFLTSATHIINTNWNSKNCHLYASGNYTKIQGSNQSFSGGLNTPFISLKSQAEFSKDSSVGWNPSSAGEEMCGSTNAGWASAPFAGGEAVPATGCGPADNPSMDGSTATVTDTVPAC